MVPNSSRVEKRGSFFLPWPTKKADLADGKVFYARTKLFFFCKTIYSHVVRINYHTERIYFHIVRNYSLDVRIIYSQVFFIFVPSRKELIIKAKHFYCLNKVIIWHVILKRRLWT